MHIQTVKRKWCFFVSIKAQMWNYIRHITSNYINRHCIVTYVISFVHSAIFTHFWVKCATYIPTRTVNKVFRELWTQFLMAIIVWPSDFFHYAYYMIFVFVTESLGLNTKNLPYQPADNEGCWNWSNDIYLQNNRNLNTLYSLYSLHLHATSVYIRIK